jgi:dynamin 1-like protein
MVHQELTRIVWEIEIPELNRFSNLRNRIRKEMTSILDEHLKPSYGMIENLIKIQFNYINTRHPNFAKSHETVYKMYDDEEQKKLQE